MLHGVCGLKRLQFKGFRLRICLKSCGTDLEDFLMRCCERGLPQLHAVFWRKILVHLYFFEFIYHSQKTRKLTRNRQNLENRIEIFEFLANSDLLKSSGSKPGTHSWENRTGNPERWGILSLSPLPCPAQLMVWGEWKIFEIRPLDFEDVFYFFKWC